MNRNIINRILQNTSHPKGFWGRMIIYGMNRFHTPLALRGLDMIEWQPGWNVLDVGCGGGANLKRLMKLCPDGKIYGIDSSEESVSFSRKHNLSGLDKRCFIRLGDVCSLPYPDETFDTVTAFETVYFWTPLDVAFSEVFRVLRPEGRFLISVEACEPEKGRIWTERISGMIIRSPENLEESLRKAGFVNIIKNVKDNEAHIVACKKQK